MKKPSVQVFCSHTKMMKVSELKKLVHPKNPNSHPRDQVDAMARILVENGWRSPITISNRSGLIIRGHGRLAGAEKAGCKEAPVDYQDYASERDEMADMIADNRIQQQSILDIDSCLDIMSDLGIDSVECGAFGFTEMDFDSYMSLPDMSDMSGHYQKKSSHDDNDDDRSADGGESARMNDPAEVEEKKPRGKLTFKCPNCGHEVL